MSTHLKPRFTAAVIVDAGGTWQEASLLARTAILAELRPETLPPR